MKMCRVVSQTKRENCW